MESRAAPQNREQGGDRLLQLGQLEGIEGLKHMIGFQPLGQSRSKVLGFIEIGSGW